MMLPMKILTAGIVALLEAARHKVAQTVNAMLTATHWEIGRRIVEFEQFGSIRADYGDRLLITLSHDLTAKLGRGFGVDNLQYMRNFFIVYSLDKIYATMSRKFATEQIANVIYETPSRKSATEQILDNISATPSRKSATQRIPDKSDILQSLESDPLEDYLVKLAALFPLSWSHYVRLLSVKTDEAREFYEIEAIRGGWSIRQLDRQISTLFYERTALSKNKAAMLTKGAETKPEDIITVEDQIRDPVVLEFLNLKDEYSETELEESLIHHLESFLLELGNDFTFVGRQKRIRIGNTWYRMDLLFYHRRLRCLVIIDLKTDKFTHADVGQMNLYLNYAWEHLTLPEENPPVGLILCSEKDQAAAHYALGNLLNKVMAAEYQLALPDPKKLAKEIEKTRQILQRFSQPPANNTIKVANANFNSRQNRFLGDTQKGNEISCQEYAEKMKISVATARRDLQRLHAEGYVDKLLKGKKIFFITN